VTVSFRIEGRQIRPVIPTRMAASLSFVPPLRDYRPDAALKTAELHLNLPAVPSHLCRGSVKTDFGEGAA